MKAVVGLPCQIEAIRKIEILKDRLNASWIDEIGFTIGLFCRENWMFTCFKALLEDFGESPENFKKFDIKKGKLLCYKDDDVLEIPLKYGKPYVRIGCRICLDFSAELADISVGSVGSEMGWSTVIIRTKKGKEIFDGAVEAGYLEVGEVNLKPVKKLCKDKRESALKEIEERQKSGLKVLYNEFDIGVDEIVERAKGKSFKDLLDNVVEQGACTSCGACASVCEYINVDAFPSVKTCEVRGLCYLACPRTALPKKAIEEKLFPNANRDEDFGYYIEIVSAKSKDEDVKAKAQDGGVVTTLLLYALEQGLIDSAVTVKHENWKPVVTISKSREELLASAGSVYSYATILPHLR